MTEVERLRLFNENVYCDSNRYNLTFHFSHGNSSTLWRKECQDDKRLMTPLTIKQNNIVERRRNCTKAEPFLLVPTDWHYLTV